MSIYISALAEIHQFITWPGQCLHLLPCPCIRDFGDGAQSYSASANSGTTASTPSATVNASTIKFSE
jgi:hypothetical protein